MPMPGENSINNKYRYAYQGQEKDPETGKEAFELRLWDARIGRWLTTDPAGQFYSPYNGIGNNPINGVDPDGVFVFTAIGAVVGGVTAAINGDNIWAGIGTGALAGGLVDITIATGGGALLAAGVGAAAGYGDSLLTDVINGRKANHKAAAISATVGLVLPAAGKLLGKAIAKPASKLIVGPLQEITEANLKYFSKLFPNKILNGVKLDPKFKTLVDVWGQGGKKGSGAKAAYENFDLNDITKIKLDGATHNDIFLIKDAYHSMLHKGQGGATNPTALYRLNTMFKILDNWNNY